MIYQESKGKIMITHPQNFHIGDILECGQCFRFQKLGHMHYSLTAFGKMLIVQQKDDFVEFWYKDKPLSKEEFDTIWVPYFDLQRDYAAIISKITKSDATMQTAADFAPGIRILAQDPWETLISFIISQNNRISMIKNSVASLSRRYGTPIDRENHAFPTLEQLAAATPDGLRDCKVGFRDKYIMDAVNKVATGQLPMNRNNNMPTADLREALLSVHGVGEKVAHCVLLFGYGRFDTFPVDVWVRRVMEQYYFDGKPTKAAAILDLAQEHFGEYSGFAQQYLFHFIRTGEKASK